jgi:ribosome biogenesis GTPase
LNPGTLTPYGWDDRWAEQFVPYEHEGSSPGRVIAEHRGEYSVMTAAGEVRAKLPGKSLHDAEQRSDLPAVGDWLALEATGPGRASVRAILPRRSKFSRKVAWAKTEEQIVAVNVDTVFVVSSLNSELNPRRLERYLTLAWESGATPVVVLTKSDLALSLPDALEDARDVSPGVPVHAVSAVDDVGVDELRPYFDGAKSVALLGSSGTGKSTLINRLIGRDVQRVQDIGPGDKGRHTTTARELLVLPTGGVVIDTPGMRELQLWDAGEGLGDAFQDIEEIALACRFRDCAHESEPGCAVRAAIRTGSLPEDRLESFHKLERELRYLAVRQDQRAASLEKRKFKVLTKAQRRSQKS